MTKRLFLAALQNHMGVLAAPEGNLPNRRIHQSILVRLENRIILITRLCYQKKLLQLTTCGQFGYRSYQKVGIFGCHYSLISDSTESSAEVVRGLPIILEPASTNCSEPAQDSLCYLQNRESESTIVQENDTI